MKHTPGPWEVSTRQKASQGSPSHRIFSTRPHGWTQVAKVYTDTDEGVSNARLISAAPDMKSALETVLFGLTDDVKNNDGKVDLDGLINTVKDALKKTEGS